MRVRLPKKIECRQFFDFIDKICFNVKRKEREGSIMKRIFSLIIVFLLVQVTIPTLAQDVPDTVHPDPPTGSNPHFGSSPFHTPTATDTTFWVDRASGLDTGCTFRSGGPLKFTISIIRVVGDVNPDGTLIDPQTLINNGVISKSVALRMPAFDVDFDAVLPQPFQPERDRVRLNGKDIGPQGSVTYLTGANNVWKLNEFIIPIELIRFGKRNIGGSPTPGLNEVEILINQANVSIGRELWCTAIDWAEISFDALAPVIMIHGNDSSGAFFAGIVNAQKGITLPFQFIEPFQQQKIPFDNSINMTIDTIANHGNLLAGLIPQKAAEFGARHVHLVAHSKGGLDCRDFLARTLPPNFGVLSLTTLSTPHNGSVGADYLLDSVNANVLLSDNPTRVYLAQKKAPDAGTPNLRVSFVDAFNTTNLPLLPPQLTVDGITKPVTYMSFSADANLNNNKTIFGDPIIEEDEVQGIPRIIIRVRNIDIDVTVWAMQILYRLMGEVASTTLATTTISNRTVFVVRETPTTSFQLNDFLVTVSSARITGFRELASVKDNHATIANPNIGQTTINNIRAVQPVRFP